MSNIVLQDAFSHLFELGPLEDVIDLLDLTYEEADTLQHDFIAYLKVGPGPQLLEDIGLSVLLLPLKNT